MATFNLSFRAAYPVSISRKLNEERHMPTHLNTLNRRPTVVIGSGVVGASAACALVARGVNVLLLEQFQPGHDLGSSHGESRIIRYSYSDPFYASLMGDAFRAWAKLEADTGVSLYVRTGGLSFGPADSDYVPKIAANLKSLDVPCRLLSAAEVVGNYPGLRVPKDFLTVFEPSAGVLLASKAVKLLLELSTKVAGALFELRPNYSVQSLDMDGEYPVIVGPNQERIEAERVIVAAGGWVKKLLPREASSIEVTRQNVFYLRPENLDAYRPGRWPVIIYKGDDDMDLFYSLPAMSDQGVKLARHGGPVCDPEKMDRDVTEKDWEPVRDYIRKYLPAWDSAEIVSRSTCLYTMTHDEDFRVGPLEKHPRVILASPCSGHGFKFGPLIGRIVADLCETGMSDYNLQRWNPKRNSEQHKASL